MHFDASTKDNQQNTLIHMACRHENLALLKIISSRTTDFNARNMYDETPLHIACSVNNLAAIKILK
jgi:ankyrin repeat protein